MGGVACTRPRAESYKECESHEYTIVCLDEASCVYEVRYTARKDGAFMLHVWADERNERSEKTERISFAGSPFHCAVAAGGASAATSFVEGLSKESKEMDKHGKKTVDATAKDVIVAGDSVILRMVICDGLKNQTTVDDAALDIRIVYPDGTEHRRAENPQSLKFTCRHDYSNPARSHAL